jgi:GNAT superfamily N-acetyltransferase
MEVRARYTRLGRLPSGWWAVTAVSTDGVDGEQIEGSADGEALWTVGDGGSDLARVDLHPALLPDPPPLWFVIVEEAHASPPAVNLVAYSDPAVTTGAVLTKYRYAGLGIANDRQVGAVRWYRDGGKVHQLFVAPQWRRRRVASALLYTADAVHQARGWEGHLHGDGRRTALGQLLIDSFRHPQRVALLDRVMPPMDPDAAG